jgi:hypothetical protein
MHEDHQSMNAAAAGKILDRLLLLQHPIPNHDLQQFLQDTGCLDGVNPNSLRVVLLDHFHTLCSEV